MKFQKTKKVKTPQYGSPGSAGLDFYVPEGFNFMLEPGGQAKIPSGIKVELDQDWHLIAFNKSGRAMEGLDVGATVVDSDYRGEIHLHVFNRGWHPFFIEENTKLVQFLLMYVPQTELIEVEDIANDTDRGEGGFGSTGIK